MAQAQEVARTGTTPTSGTGPASGPASGSWLQNAYGNGFLATMMPGTVGNGVDPGTTRTATDFSTRARALFNSLDTDKDGYVSGAEIDAALLDKSRKGDDAAVIATLKDLWKQIEDLSNDEWGPENDGVTLADLEAYERKGTVPKELAGGVEAMNGYGKGKIAGASSTVFNGAVDPTAVQQGRIGDCYFLAALVGKGMNDPDAIKKMITDNGNNTYTVTFPGKPGVTVDALSQGEIARYSTAGGNGLWLAIIEKAYGKVRNDAAWSKTGVQQDAADGGAHLSAGIEAVTGADTDDDILTFTSLSTTRTKLIAAMKERRVVTAGTTGSGNKNGIVGGHAYTVMAYDAGADTITVRNPWGSTEPMNAQGAAKDGKDDGIFTLPLKDFDDAFHNITYQE